jgi:hypothetical protein
MLDKSYLDEDPTLDQYIHEMCKNPKNDFFFMSSKYYFIIINEKRFIQIMTHE